MLLSVLFVRFRDIQPIWDVSSQMLFYASPIIYPVYYYSGRPRPNPAAAAASSPARARRVLMLQPDRGADRRRRATRWSSAPTGAQPLRLVYALGGCEYIAIPLGIIAFLFVLGVWFFNHEAPRISENL